MQILSTQSALIGRWHILNQPIRHKFHRTHLNECKNCGIFGDARMLPVCCNFGDEEFRGGVIHEKHVGIFGDLIVPWSWVQSTYAVKSLVVDDVSSIYFGFINVKKSLVLVFLVLHGNISEKRTRIFLSWKISTIATFLFQE